MFLAQISGGNIFLSLSLKERGAARILGYHLKYISCLRLKIAQILHTIVNKISSKLSRMLARAARQEKKKRERSKIKTEPMGYVH